MLRRSISRELLRSESPFGDREERFWAAEGRRTRIYFRPKLYRLTTPPANRRERSGLLIQHPMLQLSLGPSAEDVLRNCLCPDSEGPANIKTRKPEERTSPGTTLTIVAVLMNNCNTRTINPKPKKKPAAPIPQRLRGRRFRQASRPWRQSSGVS